MHHFMGHTLKLIALLSLTLASCAESSQQDNTFIKTSQGDTTFQTDTTRKALTASATNSSNSDTLIVDRPAAVFIEPDSLQIEKRKKQVGEEDFYTGADDYLFYMSTAHEFLDSVKLTTFSAKDKRFIKFINSDKTHQVIRLDKLDELWSVYFFDPTKKAKQVDMTTIDEEYRSYFR
jgi:hypothetical protein